MTVRLPRALVLLPLLALLSSPGPLLAAAPPDAGQSLQSIQAAPLPPPPANNAAPLPAAPAVPAESAPAGATRVVITAFVLSGNDSVPEATLQAQLADLRGKELGLDDLYAAARRLTAWYRQHGFVLAHAILPAQEVRGGVVHIQVLEGRLGAVRIHNQSQLPTRLVDNELRRLPSGLVVQAGPLEDSLLQLNSLPGVAVHSALSPGATPGTSDLDLELSPAPKVSGGLSLDNDGNSYTGATRLGGDMTVNNPLLGGDQLTVNGLVSNEKQYYGRGQYDLIVGPYNSRVGGAYSWLGYHLGRGFAALDASGSAGTTSLYASQAWLNQRERGFSTQLDVDHKQLDDRTAALDLDSRKHIDELTLSGNGFWRDSLGGGAASSYSLGWSAGQLGLDSPDAVQQDQLLHSAGDFHKFTAALQRQQWLGSRYLLNAQLHGQLSNHNLDSSEQMILGGANGVRAYPQGEAAGDEGWLANLELRRLLNPYWQAGVFADTGGVSLNAHPLAGAGDNHRQLSGAGLGAWWQPSPHWQASLSAAMPLGSAKATSDTPRRVYFWGQLAYRF